MQQHWFHTVWPFVGGGAAIVMVAIQLSKISALKIGTTDQIHKDRPEREERLFATLRAGTDRS